MAWRILIVKSSKASSKTKNLNFLIRVWSSETFRHSYKQSCLPHTLVKQQQEMKNLEARTKLKKIWKLEID